MAVDENGVEIVEAAAPVAAPAASSDSEKRFKDLSSKVKTEAEAREAAEAKTLEVERERDFYVGFADVVSSNPAAKEHKDDILAKVKSGYTVEDATFAVLGKAGKLGAPAPVVEHTPIAGGSASTSIGQGGAKPLSEMTRDEKRAALMEAEKRGDISLT